MSNWSTVPPPATPPAMAETLSFAGYAGKPGAIIGVGFWPRAGARIIDMVVHYLVGLLTGFAIGILILIYALATAQPVAPLIQKLGHMGVAGFIGSLLGSLAYHTICESAHGSTLGKLLLSFVVVQEDGSPCKFRAAAVRSLAYLVDALFFGVVGYFAMNKSPQQQRHGDEWAHTIVCKRSQVQPANLRPGSRFAWVFCLAIVVDAFLMAVGLALSANL